METVCQFALGVRRDTSANLLDVAFQSPCFGSQSGLHTPILGGKFVSNTRLFVIGNSRGTQGSARDVALPIGYDIDQCIGADHLGTSAALCKIESACGDQQNGGECECPPHSSRRTDSRYRL